mmetsp:Transcript_20931/g.50406  ORF Transcript_20931/g.50406 Transcript_20931/m.50406 type:complete len:236 (-) Transcript_20931:626-1333(-)
MLMQSSFKIPHFCTPSRHSGLNSLSPKLPSNSLTTMSALDPASRIMPPSIGCPAASRMSHPTTVTTDAPGNATFPPSIIEPTAAGSPGPCPLFQLASDPFKLFKYSTADGFFSTATILACSARRTRRRPPAKSALSPETRDTAATASRTSGPRPAPTTRMVTRWISISTVFSRSCSSSNMELNPMPPVLFSCRSVVRVMPILTNRRFSSASARASSMASPYRSYFTGSLSNVSYV